MRHIEIGLLWVQHVSAEQRLEYGKVLGKVNPTDLYTQYLDWVTLGRHLSKLRYEFEDGRAGEAPKLHNLSMSMDECNFMVLWEPWEWMDVIVDVVKHEGTKPSKSHAEGMCVGEINMLCEYGGSLEQSVLQGNKRQVHEVQRVQPCPAWPSLGFDPNLSIRA